MWLHGQVQQDSVAGSCENSCNAVTVSLTGTTTTAGTTCSSTVLGNALCWDGATNQAGTTECSAFNCKVLKIIISLNIYVTVN